MFSIVAASLIIEALSRANSIRALGSHSRVYHSIADVSNSSHFEIEASRVSDTEITFTDRQMISKESLCVVGEEKFEIIELCEIFIGTAGKHVYSFILFLYMYGTLWAYSTVFANAFSTMIDKDGGPSSFIFFLAIFGMLVTVLSLMELNEQVMFQVILSLCRVFMILAMVASILLALAEGTQAFSDFQPSENSDELNPLYAVRPNKLYLFLPIAAYANIFHHSIPALSQPVGDKSQLTKIFAAALLISGVGYTAVGVTIATYFGPHTFQNSNLNWRFYIRGGLLSWFIVLFPAFDVASAYPLNAITLGNSLMTAFYGKQRIHELEDSRLLRSAFRLLAAVPPVILAAFVRDLGKITDYTGLTGFAIAFIFPPLLAMASEKYMRDRGLPSQTIYSSWLTSKYVQWVTLILGVTLTVYVSITLLLDYGRR